MPVTESRLVRKVVVRQSFLVDSIVMKGSRWKLVYQNLSGSLGFLKVEINIKFMLHNPHSSLTGFPISINCLPNSEVPCPVIIALHIQHLLLRKLHFQGAGALIYIRSMQICPLKV